MLRKLLDRVLLFILAIAGGYCDSRQESRAGERAAGSEGGSVILVVSDGLRWQEVFRGADSALLFDGRRAPGREGTVARRRYWRPTVSERRAALMPFVWSTMAREGTLLGNRDVGSAVSVTNGLNFSYPGYNEMLVGYPDARINANDVGPNPNVTVFEWINRREEFRGSVAAVGAWSTFADIFNARRSRIHMHASREPPLDDRAHAAAMRVLDGRRPRALFVAYVETDDMAHEDRYDLTLNAAHAVDAHLAELWSAVQAHQQYRGRTTLIFTTDHGRGSTQRDWTDHGQDVPGADQTWLAVMGPRTRTLGEARETRHVTAQIAATAAAALGLDYRRETPAAARAMGDIARRQR